MLIVRPFRGIIYNKDKVGDLSELVTPPYDVISPSQQDFYYKLHPYNIVRIILGKEKAGDDSADNKYTRAAKFFRHWLSRRILIKEKQPSIYTYSQRYHLDGEQIQRKGFVALMKLQEFSSGQVFPHEHVFPEPQKDRLNLMLACQANFSAIFALFSGPGGEIDTLCQESESLFEFEDSDGIKHKLSSIADQALISKICFSMREKKVFIADGHHRYLTALKFKDEVKKRLSPPAGADYVMMCFLNMNSPGVTILPVHRLVGALTLTDFRRLVEGIENFFYKRPFKKYTQADKEITVAKRLLSEIKKAKDCLFGMYTREEGYFLLSPKNPRALSGKIKSAILDEVIKHLLGREDLRAGEEIDFTPSSTHAVREVQKGKFQIAFFLPPTSVEEIKRVALAGGRMPPKSSYFYPKLPSGLIMRDLEDAV